MLIGQAINPDDVVHVVSQMTFMTLTEQAQLL
jgi:hypothetical protein